MIERAVIKRYTLALGAVGVALLLRMLLSGIVSDIIPFALFYSAVVVSAMVGGFGPGMLAAVLSALIVVYLLISPTYSHLIYYSGDIVATIVFIATSLFISLVAEAYRVERRRTAELEKQIVKQQGDRRLSLLSEISGQLLQTHDPQALVQSLCERVMNELGCDCFFNFLVDNRHGILKLNAYAGIPDRDARSLEWLEMGSAVCGCVAESGCGMVAEDIQNRPGPQTEFVHSIGMKAYACHPLLSEGAEVIGTISFGSRSVTCFHEDDVALMKAVADQVATALNRKQLQLEAQERADTAVRDQERLRLAQRVAHVGTFDLDFEAGISHWTSEMESLYGLQPGSFSGQIEDWLAMVYPADREMSMRQLEVAKITGTLDFEFRVIWPDETVRWLASSALVIGNESGRPLRLIGVNMDITERKNQEQREREIEAQKQEFYKKTIMAATEGKLIFSERKEIEAMAGSLIKCWDLCNYKSVAEFRDQINECAVESGMSEERAVELLGSAVEAAGNAVKHTGGGAACLHEQEDSLLLVVSDRGQGIGTMSLPEVALTRGYSTAGTLGMGYKLMILLSDKVYLATGSEGTVVAIKKYIEKQDELSEYESLQPLSCWED